MSEQNVANIVIDIAVIDAAEMKILLKKNATIDDSAGDGDTDETWSADKLVDQFAAKADKSDTVLDTTLSRGRSNIGGTGTGSFAFGNNVAAEGNYSHAEGNGTYASGQYSHAEGYSTSAGASGNNQYPGQASHAEGRSANAYGNYSHAEGYGSYAYGQATHAEGRSTIARNNYSHAEGQGTDAEAECSHVSGMYNIADSYSNWSEFATGTHYEVGDKVKVPVSTMTGQSFAGYICNTDHTSSDYFDESKWDEWGQKMNYAEIIGNGRSSSAKSNARALSWDGNEYLKGDIYVGCNADSTGGTKVATVDDLSGSVASVTETQAMIADYYGGE